MLSIFIEKTINIEVHVSYRNVWSCKKIYI